MTTETSNEKSFSTTLVIKDFENKTGEQLQIETHFGLDWHLCVTFDISDNKWFICMFGDYEELAEKRSRVSVRGSLSFVKPTHQQSIIVTGERVRLVLCDHSCFVKQSLKFEDTVKENMVNGDVTIRCDVNVYMDHPPFKMDFSSSSDSDVVLLVENQEFNVSKAVLGAFSSVLRAMLSGKYAESEKSVIPIEGVDSDEFQELLEIIYHKTDVTIENAREILGVVNYFDVVNIRDKCEKVLLNAPDILVPLKEKLLLADKYVLPELLDHAMTSITKIKELTASLPKDAKKLSSSTHLRIVQKIIDLSE